MDEKFSWKKERKAKTNKQIEHEKVKREAQHKSNGLREEKFAKIEGNRRTKRKRGAEREESEG